MNLRQIRTFVTIAEQRTVSKAALRLRIAQPALSRQIKDFEDELGIRLFDRLRRRLVLTGEGETLLTDCRNILNAVDSLSARARLLGRAEAGVLRVAATMLDEVFATFLHHYAERFPNVRVILSEIEGAADLYAKLESADAHLGIGLLRLVQAEKHEFENFTLPAIEFLAAGHASSPLGTAGNIEVADIEHYPLLLLTPNFHVRKTFDEACRLAGVKPRVFMESRNAHTLLVLAEAGHGVAIVPFTLPIHRYRLRIARVMHQGDPLREPLTVLWDERHVPSYAKSFCELLDAYMREVFPILRQPDRATSGAAQRVPARRK